MKQINESKQSDHSFSTQYQYYQSYSFDYWFARHRYYHQRVVSFYRSMIPAKSSVLHVQCKNGYVLEALDVKHAVGVESDERSLSLARKRLSHYQFYTALKDIPRQRFDYILLSFATMETDDIYTLFTYLHRFCHKDTRLIIESYSSIWAPILALTQKLGLRRPTALKNWVSFHDLNGFLSLAQFEMITAGAHMLLPIYIPVISWLLNNVIAHLPLLNRLCLHQWVLIRPHIQDRKKDTMVSIIIPCRNEEGNVEAAITRTPKFGKHIEFIFVEGHSKDDTLAEIKRVKAKYPTKDIHYLVQEGTGKGDAVRAGFAQANGEILIILDADLTTPPEEMPKFYEALINGQADFINGSRLVYGMESKAMGFLAWLANRAIGQLISWAIGQKVSDTLCGTKVLWKKDYESIDQNRKHFGMWDPYGDFDLLCGAAKLNLKIIDVPVHYKRRTYGKTNISRFKEVWFLWWMGIRAWWLLKVRP